jgi:hypothetical protein
VIQRLDDLLQSKTEALSAESFADIREVFNRVDPVIHKIELLEMWPLSLRLI